LPACFVTVLPETSRIADGIKKALREVDDDVRAAAKRWRHDIDRELGKPEVEVTADTRPAERKIDELEPDRDRALEPAVRPGDTPVVRRPGDHQQRAGRRGRARIGNRRSRFGHRHQRRRPAMERKRNQRQFWQNLVFARCESRYATSVFSLLGVVTLDLTA
jgi:hypothetical protein